MWLAASVLTYSRHGERPTGPNLPNLKPCVDPSTRPINHSPTAGVCISDCAQCSMGMCAHVHVMHTLSHLHVLACTCVYLYY